MNKSKWNRIESIPVSSLTEDELKQAIKEWSEGSKQLESLLWTCYKNGIKTSGCHTGKHANFVYLSINLEGNTPRDILKCMLSEVEKFGNAQVNLHFGGNPLSGPEWHKTSIFISSKYALQADRLWENLDKAITEKHSDNQYICFSRILDFYDFLQDKDCGLTCRMYISAYHMYEIKFDDSGPESTTEYFSAFFDKLGFKTEKDSSKKFWVFKTGDKSVFKDMLDKICEAFEKEYSLEKPTEITQDMTFNYRAFLMQKKFGYTRAGIQKMNDWINENSPRSDGCKVNY